MVASGKLYEQHYVEIYFKKEKYYCEVRPVVNCQCVTDIGGCIHNNDTLIRWYQWCWLLLLVMVAGLIMSSLCCTVAIAGAVVAVAVTVTVAVTVCWYWY